MVVSDMARYKRKRGLRNITEWMIDDVDMY